MNKTALLLVVLVLGLVVVLGFYSINSRAIYEDSYVSINDKKIKVEIADSQAEMERGLMYRTSLDANSGMLFVFPGSEIRSFWMKNTLIPLDIIFIQDNFEIVDIQNMQPCLSEPCPLYVSSKPAKYALEVNSGFAEMNNLSMGDSVEIEV